MELEEETIEFDEDAAGETVEESQDRRVLTMPAEEWAANYFATCPDFAEHYFEKVGWAEAESIFRRTTKLQPARVPVLIDLRSIRKARPAASTKRKFINMIIDDIASHPGATATEIAQRVTGNTSKSSMNRVREEILMNLSLFHREPILRDDHGGRSYRHYLQGSGSNE